MVNRYTIGISLLVMLVWGTPRAGATSKEQLQTKWEGLSAIVGRKVRVVMPDGARIEGRATTVEVDALAVDIYKSSNKTAYPKGKFLVPRATLKAVDVERNTRHWQVVGLAVGGGVGVFFGVLARDSTKGFINSTGAAAGFGAAAVAMPVLGYLIGHSADRRTITYVITP
jgi:hypothetical protein